MELKKFTKKYTTVLIILFTGLFINVAYTNNSGHSLLWPEAPSVVDKELFVDGKKPNTRVPLITFNTPLPDKNVKDPLRLLGIDNIQGVIIHAPSLIVSDAEMRQQFFVFNGININGHIDKQQSHIATYRTKTYGYTYDPQISPDGKNLLYKNGWPFDSGASFGIYIWNFKNKTIKSVLKLVVWTRVQWSPNSRYIAYVTGGDPSGMRKSDDDHINLWAYDTQEHKNYILAKDVAAQILMANQKYYYVRGPATYRTFFWTPQNTLLFTKQREITDSKEDKALLEPPRPDIYEVNVPGGASQKLISKGTNPVSSPDGKIVAFFGWSDSVDRVIPKKGEEKDKDDVPKVVPPSLYLFNRASKTRVKLADIDNGILAWAPDGKYLYVLHIVDGAKPNTGRVGQLDKVDMATNKVTTVAQMKANDADGKPLSYKLFHNLYIARNGKYAIVDAYYDMGFDRFTETEMKTFLQVDLSTGKVNNIAFCLNKWASVLGWDWHDMSTPVS